MRAFTVFSTLTGLPLRQGFVPDYAYDNVAGVNEVAVEGNLGNAYYWDVVDEIPKIRISASASIASFSVNLGADIEISSLPVAPLVLKVDGIDVPVADGFLNVTPQDPGLYFVELDMKEYQYEFWTFTVTDTTPVPF